MPSMHISPVSLFTLGWYSRPVWNFICQRGGSRAGQRRVIAWGVHAKPGGDHSTCRFVPLSHTSGALCGYSAGYVRVILNCLPAYGHARTSLPTTYSACVRGSGGISCLECALRVYRMSYGILKPTAHVQVHTYTDPRQAYYLHQAVLHVHALL